MNEYENIISELAEIRQTTTNNLTTATHAIFAEEMKTYPRKIVIAAAAETIRDELDLCLKVMNDPDINEDIRRIITDDLLSKEYILAYRTFRSTLGGKRHTDPLVIKRLKKMKEIYAQEGLTIETKSKVLLEIMRK